MTILVILLILALIALAAPSFGVDTRQSREWAYRGPDDRSTALHS